jgi:hypothetical protein
MLFAATLANVGPSTRLCGVKKVDRPEQEVDKANSLCCQAYGIGEACYHAQVSLVLWRDFQSGISHTQPQSMNECFISPNATPRAWPKL